MLPRKWKCFSLNIISSLLKTHPLMKIVSNAVVDLPTPSRIRGAWNFGSLLGLCLSVQIFTGIFLAIHYIGRLDEAFSRVRHIIRDVNLGWLFRLRHANGARFFFIVMYLHILRGLYYGSYNYALTWASGVLILLLVQGTAFLGYVLPWGQISFWGATVITNLVSSIPYVGDSIVIWLWGGFSVDGATLTRFFAIHYLLPFLLIGLVGAHLLFLHESGSNNPLGLSSRKDKICFYPYYIEKDLLGFLLWFLAFFVIVFWFPLTLGDPENYLPANCMVTPVHIQPEWYFLFAYAILRRVPNKLGGVVAMLFAILIFLILIFEKNCNFRSLSFYPVNKIFFFLFVLSVVGLTFLGAAPIERPYVELRQGLRVFYFSYFFLRGPIKRAWDYF